MLVIVDPTTLFIWAYCLRTKRSDEVLQHVQTVFNNEGFQPDIRSDNGGEFLTLLDEFAASYGKKVNRIIPMHSRSNVCSLFFSFLCFTQYSFPYFLVSFVSRNIQHFCRRLNCCSHLVFCCFIHSNFFNFLNHKTLSSYISFVLSC